MMFRQLLLARLVRVSFGLLLVCAPAVTARPGLAVGDKMAPQEVAAKHLDSIGSAAARAAVRNRIIPGTTTITLRGGGRGSVEGRALFRHLRTDYERVVAATMGAAPGQSASRRETRFRIREDFSDFKEEGGLTLPHTYKFQLNVQSQTNPIVLDWAFSLVQFAYNQSMGVREFNTEA